ncbi:hypothetical protein K290105B7_13080 [Anaerostipes caccae]|nr:hypothetical protein ANCC_13660 [Anaerostipes caccae L1-92]
MAPCLPVLRAGPAKSATNKLLIQKEENKKMAYLCVSNISKPFFFYYLENTLSR